MILIAQQLPTPSGSELMTWLGCAALVIFAAEKLLDLKRKWFGGEKHQTEVTPQPLEVREAHRLVTDVECGRRSQDIQKQIEELKEARRTADIESSKHRKSVYDRIEQVRKELSDKLDNIPPQIVAQLLNTKQLWKEK